MLTPGWQLFQGVALEEKSPARQNLTRILPAAQAGALYNATRGFAVALTTGSLPATRELTE